MASSSVKLVCGAYELDLKSGNYGVTDDFVPPTVLYAAVMAEGSVTNRRGAKTASKTPKNRNWGFSLNVYGDSVAEVRWAASVVQSFLALAGKTKYPVYVEWRDNADVPAPLWGTFGAPLRFEVVFGSLQLSKAYGKGGLRGAAVNECQVQLVIKPTAKNPGLQLATASGGVLEEMVGSSDGIPLGTRILEATSNIIPNPIFAHTTPSTGWAASGCLAQAVTDPKFVYPGSQTAYELTGTSVTNAYNIAVSSAAVTYVITAYVCKRDGSAVTTADVNPWEGSGAAAATGAAISCTITAVGNGVYRVVSSKYTGIVGTRYYGVALGGVGKRVILLGMQVEAKNFWTPLAHGDLLGHRWASTPHNSVSTRAAGMVKIDTPPDQYNVGAGCIRMAVTWGAASATAADMPGGGFPMFFDDDAGTAFQGGWEVSTQRFYFQCGGATTYSSATSIVAGATDILHFVWGPSGRTLYRNGVSILTAVTTAYVQGTYIVFGSNNAAGNFSDVLFLELSMFDRELTAAQVLADYTNLYALISNGKRAAPIPMLWVKDGDDVTDNCLDSTRDNMAVALGIPGTAETEPEIRMSLGGASTANKLYLGVLSAPVFVPGNTVLFGDQSGTVDASCCGGEYKNTAAVTTSDLSIASYSIREEFYQYIEGLDCALVGRLYDAGSNLLVKANFTHNYSVEGGYRASTLASAAWGMHFCAFRMPVYENDIASSIFQLIAKRTTGSAAVRCDFVAILPNPAIYTVQGNRKVYINGPVVEGLDTVNAVLLNTEGIGKPIRLTPGYYNEIMTLLGDNGITSTITWTVTYEKFVVTPEYELL